MKRRRPGYFASKLCKLEEYITKADVQLILSEFFSEVQNELKLGNSVELSGVGTLMTASHNYVDIKTKEQRSAKVVRFRVSATLKEVVNGKDR